MTSPPYSEGIFEDANKVCDADSCRAGTAAVDNALAPAPRFEALIRRDSAGRAEWSVFPAAAQGLERYR